jgi:hypothetical protein
MKLENASRTRQVSTRAIAAQSSGEAAATADHSHSHQSLPRARGSPAEPAQPKKPTIAVSSELAAYVARRTT